MYFFILHRKSISRWSGKKMRFCSGKPVRVREFLAQDIVATLKSDFVLNIALNFCEILNDAKFFKKSCFELRQ